jgi:hypothetical protein
MDNPVLQIQEIPYDDPESRYMFRPGPGKQFVATPAAIAMYPEAICRCLTKLQELAAKKNGLDYLQMFDDPDKSESLWFMEDEQAITALLPSDH